MAEELQETVTLNAYEYQELKEAQSLVIARLEVDQCKTKVHRLTALARFRVDLAEYRKRYFEKSAE